MTTVNFTSSIKRRYYLSNDEKLSPLMEKLTKIISDSFCQNPEILMIEISPDANFEFTYVDILGNMSNEYCELPILSRNTNSHLFDFINSHLGEFLSELHLAISRRINHL